MNCLVDDMGHHFPVDIIGVEMNSDGYSEFTVRTISCVPRNVGGFLYRLNTKGIKKVIFNDPATIVLWADGTKTVVKCQEGDTYSREQGLALCIAKKYFGNKSNFNNEFKRWLNE